VVVVIAPVWVTEIADGCEGLTALPDLPLRYNSCGIVARGCLNIR
jgi:hypothetical protein